MFDAASHIDVIQGRFAGPRVAILGSVHGNERIGAKIIAALKKEVTPELLHGKLTLILGNPQAYKADKRFIDADLNRLFGEAFNALNKRPLHECNTEEKRALEIAPFLERADYLLDIHSTIKPSVSFVYCKNTNEHLRLAAVLETDYIVTADSTYRTADLISSTDNYVDHHGGIGITYEAGWSKELENSSATLEKTYRFLYAIGSMQPAKKSLVVVKKSTALSIYGSIIPKNAQFHFAKDFSNFDVVNKGEMIAQDGEKIIRAARKSRIVFPKIDITPGRPACYLAFEV